ncbi:phage major capsid protein, HK97 family [Mameliella alba]|uniref:phage major capsid protein n=1 Tax=Mameliella alba TaxID=561184 RepID=UPI00087F7072|nr:phage major capsid protein [Mameliella alba]OWV41893.1 phage major capsid protein [Mameliella alba]PTR35546.1 HK97 family phage major capsid protein [Mameliella alba]GGF82808.1 nucleoid-structuring protein H-NS [Mameliella alba]SDE20375.1 phage major capsid protein, HK97 family [Mameliella alba]
MKHVPFSVMASAMIASAPAGVLGNPRADAGNVAQLLKDVRAEVGGLRDDVMKKAEAAVKQAEKGEALSTELKAQIDEIMPKFNEATQAQAKLEGQLLALEARTLDVEQLAASGGRGGQAQLSVGAEVAQSDELKAYVEGGLQGSFTFKPQAAITTVDTSGAAWSERETTPVNMARRALRIRGLLNVVNTGASVIEYAKQTTRTDNTGMVAEGGTIPAGDLGWTQTEVNVRKIAESIPVSDEAIADIARLQGEIDGELRYALNFKEETQILAGDGTGQNLSGLITEATAFSAAAGLPDTNRIERLRLAMLQVVLNDYAADALVLNPTDWAAIELTKDSQGRFIIGNADSPAGPSLWRLPVVESNSMTVGSWLVGALAMAATLYDRQETEVLISSEHSDNFTKGMKTVKASKRVALAVKRPASLVTGDFTFI